MRSKVIALVLVVFSISAATFAAPPVPLVNYQGVLRDIAGSAVNGDFDMVFRVYDAAGSGCPPSGGSLLLEDQHLASGSGAVAVSWGMFNAAIGSGDVPGGTNLGTVFRTHTSVFLEVEVEGEILCPRTQFLSAPSALNSVNAGLLDNRAPSEFLDTSATAQAKAGSFTLGGDLRVGATLFDASPSALVVSSDQDTDALVLTAGNDQTDGELHIQGEGPMTFWAGNGTYQFWDGSTGSVQATILSDGTFIAGGAVRLEAINGPVYEPVPGGASRLANGFDFSDLFLYGGNDATDGSINIYGDSLMQLYSGDGRYTWNNGANGGQETMYLDPAGSLQMDGDLTVSGRDIFLSTQPGVSISTDIGDDDLDAVANQDVEFMLDRKNNGTNDWLRIYHDDSWLNPSLLAEFHEDGRLRVRGTITGNVAFDLAETFLASEPVEPGDLVRVDPRRGDAVMKATVDDAGAVIGVISADPGVLLGGGFMDRPSLDVWGEAVGRRFDAERPRLEARVLSRHPDLARATAERGGQGAEQQQKTEQKIESLALAEFGRQSFAAVALAGRVRVKVDASVGAIHPGDALAASPIAGVAMRAASAGPIIGTALESLEQGRGSVLALIHRGYWAPEPTPADSRATDAAASPDRAQLPMPENGEPGAARSAAVAAAREADVYARSFRPSATELATLVRVLDEVETGDVLVIDSEEPGAMRRSSEAASTAVFGVVATSPGLVLGSQSGAPSEVAVALAGVVPCKVDAVYGAVRPGDLLTTSPTPGHAMRADDPRPGAILGKALEALDHGAGTIKILVTLR